MREVHLQPGNGCQAKDLAIRRIEIFPTTFPRSNLHIFRLFLKHWIQLTQGYSYASQSMWGSQRAGIDPGGGRRWQLGDRAAKTLNIPQLICWVKPSSFPMISGPLNSPRPARRFQSPKVEGPEAARGRSGPVTVGNKR